jgi:hypothetical protein
VKYIHPIITNPETGKSSTIDGYYMKLRGSTGNQVGWIISNDWENVKGTWIFQIFYKDKLVIEKEITVK